jgi:DNA-binding CsgD family transcriptional regulator
VKVFPFSDPILLPLAPTIASTIADYLQSIAQKLNLDSPQKNSARDVIELQPDLDWHGQFQRSIRQIPTSQYQYVSTIAHQLAAKSARTPLEICQNLDLSIPTLAGLERSADLKLDCWYNEGSYIYFQLTPESIEIWLHYIHDLPLEQLGFRGTSIPTGSFLQGSGLSANDPAIYAHARCCSLLKLAAAEKLVVLTTDWQLNPSNWLLDLESTENRLTTDANHIFEHPAEHQLIQTLMAVLDAIYGARRQLDSPQTESSEQIGAGGFNGHRKSPSWTKLTIDLAQSWLEFDRRCQIFGDVKQKNPRLAIARCGLTAISRRYLQVLLENYLGVEAALEL